MATQVRTMNRTEMERCAQICHECQDACLTLVPHCLGRGGEHAAPEHINMLLDCATICGAAHNLLHRGSPLHTEACRACATICDACARDCEQLASDDAEMSDCVEACHDCARSCREMAGA